MSDIHHLILMSKILRKNVLKTLNEMIEASNLKWVKITRLQEWTPEERVTMSYCLHFLKYKADNAGDEAPSETVLERLTTPQLVDIVEHLAKDYKPGRILIETYVDELGYDAGNLHVHSNVKQNTRLHIQH